MIFEIKEITVLHRPNSTDLIFLKIEGPSPFPEMAEQYPERDYGPDLRLETRQGYAEEWLQKMGMLTNAVKVISGS